MNEFVAPVATEGGVRDLLIVSSLKRETILEIRKFQVLGLGFKVMLVAG